MGKELHKTLDAFDKEGTSYIVLYEGQRYGVVMHSVPTLVLERGSELLFLNLSTLPALRLEIL